MSNITQTIDLRLLSGAPLAIGYHEYRRPSTVAEARIQAAAALGLQPSRVGLSLNRSQGDGVAATGVVPMLVNDGDALPETDQGCAPIVLQVVVLQDPLEQKLARLAGAESFADLADEEELIAQFCRDDWDSATEDALPDSIGKLTRLKYILLEEQGFNKLPASFVQLHALQEISLMRNCLSGLPDGFGAGLLRLQRLYLGCNALTSLPADFGQLAALEELDVRANLLTHLPASFTLLSNLSRVVLNVNYLERLPDDFGNLTSLRVLHMVHNSVRALPGSFGQLLALEMFYCDSNELEALPPCFCGLVSLTSLHLSCNKLRALPGEFGNLVALEELDLEDNSFEVMPDCLQFLPSLDPMRLVIRRNPFAWKVDED